MDYPAPAPFSSEVDSWTYDAIGNRLTSVVNGTPQTYTYFKNGANPLNGQRLQSDGANSYTWSALGNLATRTGPGGNVTFGYDTALKNLAAITGAATASYTYDYQGRRSTKTAGATTTYLYDGQDLLSETKSGIPTYYLYGPGIDEPLAAYVTSGPNSGFHYFDVDGLGSVVATNSPTGTVEHHAVFDAWGVTRSETGTRFHPFTYTGREVGEAGLHYYRARYLQPGVGRFTQEDPIGFWGGPNFYAYGWNRPSSLTDPLGLHIRTQLKQKPAEYGLSTTCTGSAGATCYWSGPYRRGSCRGQQGCYGFDVAVPITIGQQFIVSRQQAHTLLSSDTVGMTLQEHEDLHLDDFRIGLAEGAMNSAIKTEGFASLQECQAARRAVSGQIDAFIRGVAAASHLSRDEP